MREERKFLFMSHLIPIGLKQAVHLPETRRLIPINVELDFLLYSKPKKTTKK